MNARANGNIFRVKNLLKMRSFKHSVVYFFKIWLDSISSKTANGMFVHCALFYFGQPAIRRGIGKTFYLLTTWRPKIGHNPHHLSIYDNERLLVSLCIVFV